MNILSLEDQIQKMQFIVYQIPVGLIEASFDGTIQQMNARGVELLMPQFFYHQLSGDNMNELLQVIAPSVLRSVQQYTKPAGCIVDQQNQQITMLDEHDIPVIRHYIFTVNKLNANSVMYIFNDISNIYDSEKQINRMLHDKAIERNKFEIASGVLHDIGNAIVGFGSYITKIKRSVEQNDITTIENLREFVEKNQSAFLTAIGEKKANAMIDLLDGVISNQKEKQAIVKNSITDQMKIIAHIQEILNIQRQYVKGQSTERALVNMRSVVNDAVAMLFGTFDKNGIVFHFEGPFDLPKLKGDRTQLMQVFLNLFKNAVDSVSTMQQEKEIIAAVSSSHSKLTVQIKDNGNGFDAETGAGLFTRGYTTKLEGTGLGLANCKSIIEGHNGEITLTSEGVGKGAVATIIFQL